MKRVSMLCLCLLLSTVALAVPAGKPAQSNDSFEAFFKKFKTAVSSGDKEAVVALSQFPIRMPGRVRNIKDAADLRLRYREVFNKYTSAAKCFATEKPVADSEKPNRFYAACFCCGGDELAYEFERTKTGWKFVRLSKVTLPD